MVGRLLFLWGRGGGAYSLISLGHPVFVFVDLVFVERVSVLLYGRCSLYLCACFSSSADGVERGREEGIESADWIFCVCTIDGGSGWGWASIGCSVMDRLID